MRVEQLLDLRPEIGISAAGTIEYHLQWQEGDGGYPITVSWSGELPPGDLFIFDDPVTFPAWLSRLLPDADVLNAGIPGYTLCDEYGYVDEDQISRADATTN